MAKKLNKLKIIIVTGVVALLAVGALFGWFLYMHYHIYASYSSNPVGRIVVDKKKIPQGWSFSPGTVASNAPYQAYIDNLNPKSNDYDHGSVIIQKVLNSSMMFSQASTQAAKLRNDKTQLLKDAGYGIDVLPNSSIIVTIDSKKVRLPTVEFSEIYTFRFEESDAFYVQNGYYINIEQTYATMQNPNPNHTELMKQTNKALQAISISR